MSINLEQITSRPLASILTTVFNRERYLADAIESVLSQTYNNWELIIVDDNSQDDSLKIAKEYAAKDSRIKVYHNAVNLGDYPNRNKAASYATGKYIKYLDADDILYPHGLQVMVSCMEAYPDAGWGVFGPDPQSRDVYPYQLSCKQVWEKSELNGFKIFGRSPLSLIIRKDIFDAIGGFTGHQHIGDYELIHKLSCIKPMVAMPSGLAWYRIHEDQQSNDNRTDLFVPFKYVKARLDLLTSLPVPMSEKLILNMIKTAKHQAAYLILYSYKVRKFKTARKMLTYINWSFLTALKYYILY